MGINYFLPLKLVGGTALALHIGHRKSIDLDFFGTLDFDEAEINVHLQRIGTYNLIHKTPNIYVFTINNIKVDFVNYPYKWIFPSTSEENIRLASKEDIAAMKLNAITGRGKKKDFYDLYYLLKEFTFKQLFGFYNRKYPDGNQFLVMRSITYFDDAEADQNPVVFEKITWDEIKSTIKNHYTKFLASNY